MKTIQPKTTEKIRKFVSEINGLINQVLTGALTKELPSMILEGIEDRLTKLVESDKPKFERVTMFQPAYDKRHSDPNKNYGIGAVKCMMVLKGDKGAVHFIFSTGILLDSTVEEYIKTGRAKYEAHEWGYHYLNKPMGYDVGYHSHIQMFEGQEPRKECEWLDGKPCYGDGSALRADEWMKIFTAEGSEKIWQMLEEDYEERFNKSHD